VQTLRMLKKQDVAVGVPNRDYDDSYVIQYAKDKKAYIVSGDGFKDAYSDDRLSYKRQNELREYIRSNCMTFTFIKDDFIPNPDFLKSKNMI
jgi:ribonuclease ZC3H12